MTLIAALTATIAAVLIIRISFSLLSPSETLLDIWCENKQIGCSFLHFYLILSTQLICMGKKMRNLKTTALLLILFYFTASAQNFWETTNGPFGGTVYNIKTLAGDSILAATSNGIFISSDLGENWSSYYHELRFTSVNDFEKFQDGFVAILDNKALVKISSALYDTIYSSSDDHPRTVAVNSNGEIFLGTDYNIYSSDDGGDTWNDRGYPGMGINFSSDIIFKNDSIIFFVDGNHIHRSYDEGLTWVKINEAFQNSPVSTIYVDNTGDLYAASGLGVLFKSVDNGDNWENIAAISINALFKDSTGFYAGRHDGIYKSSDGGYTWLNYSYGLLPGTVVRCIGQYAGKIILGTYGGGTYLLNQDSDQWISISNGMDAASIKALIIDSENDVLAGVYRMGIQRQLNDGLLKWDPANDGLSTNYIESFAVSKYDTIYCGADYGAYKSTDKGQSWTNMNSPCYNNAYGICVNSNGYVFIDSYCGVFRTTDNGVSWDLMNSNLWSNVYDIAASPTQLNVYVSDEHDFYRTTDNGSTWWRNYFTVGSAFRMRINNKGYIYILDMYGEIWRSTNSGGSFQNINNGLPSGYTFMHDIAFNSEDMIYLAAEDGLYESRDDGNSWSLVDDSEISLDINLLYFNTNNKLYAGTIRAGVYRSVNSLTNAEKVPISSFSCSLTGNYPNPFNPSTKIQYTIPRRQNVKIVVYDIIGKEISVLVNEIKSAGQYEVEFNASHLSSGIYFCRMQTGSFMSVKKMILMK